MFGELTIIRRTLWDVGVDIMPLSSAQLMFEALLFRFTSDMSEKAGDLRGLDFL